MNRKNLVFKTRFDLKFKTYELSIFKNFGKTDNLWTDKLWKTTVVTI